MTDGAGTVLVLGAQETLGEAIAARLRAAGRPAVEVAGAAEADVAAALGAIEELESLVIVARPPVLGASFLEVDDTRLEAGLAQFLDVFGALHLALPRLADGGAVVAVAANGHLGGWGGADEMAFCGAIVGVMRSVALENMARGVRANVISVELPGAGAEADPDEVADLALYLLSPAAAAVNGDLIFANHGRSLQMRAARDRRPKVAPVT